MTDKELLDILVAPDDKTPLQVADEALLKRLNDAIAAGVVENRTGRPVEEPVTAGLVRQDGTLLYPVLDGIPVMLNDEAIGLEQVGNSK